MTTVQARQFRAAIVAPPSPSPAPAVTAQALSSGTSGLLSDRLVNGKDHRVADQPLGRDSDRHRQPLGGLPKRAFDIVFTSLLLILLAPIMLIVSALIRLVMGGPAIFAQERIGFDGKTFVCYKFRTMAVNAEEVLHRHLATDPQAAREWRETRKLMRDPRVGCLGNALRKSSLDELPQLLNVLRGDMSLVGPRPIVPDELKCYGRHARACFTARPGLTGLWQTSGRNRVSYAARVARDRYYARHWSLRLDLVLLIKTIPAVMNFEPDGLNPKSATTRAAWVR